MLSNPREEKLDPRVRRTRQLLEQAFTQLIDEKGFQDTSVHDITDRAGVNRATFYAHFQDKYALLDYAIRESFHRDIEDHLLNACHFSVDNLRLLIVTVCEYLAGAPAACKQPQMQFDSLMETQVKGQIKELVQSWVEQTGLDVDPEIGATAASWAIYGLALHWSREQERSSAAAFADQVLPLVAANLRVPAPA
jgi:AcrR family transcriptional regulator